MQSVHILSLGCPKNTTSSFRLEKALSELNIEIVDDPVKAQAIIVNTCGFIDSAKEESINCLFEVSALKQDNPELKVIAIGCLVERYKDILSKDLPEVDIFLDYDNMSEMPKVLGVKGELNLVFQAAGKGASSYLEISEGCSHGCSYCAIPAIKGPFSSRAKREVLDEATYLVANGCKEIVIVGQDTGSYGSEIDSETNLAKLLYDIGDKTDVRWMRLLYLQPQHATKELIATIRDSEKICPYLDIPFQHASPGIMRAMKRWGEGRRYLEMIEELRAAIPEISLRTSIMVGFPGETDEDILYLSSFLQSAALDYVGVFEFSAEDGTPAASLADQVSSETKRERAGQIRALIDDVSKKRHERFIGEELEVLVEFCDQDLAFGRSRHQAPEIDGEVVFEQGNVKPGEIVEVKIKSYEDYDFKGKLVKCLT